MDYIDSLLIMEDDLDDDENLHQFGHSSTDHPNEENQSTEPDLSQEAGPSQESASPKVPDWCVCG